MDVTCGLKEQEGTFIELLPTVFSCFLHNQHRLIFPEFYLYSVLEVKAELSR